MEILADRLDRAAQKRERGYSIFDPTDQGRKAAIDLLMMLSKQQIAVSSITCSPFGAFVIGISGRDCDLWQRPLDEAPGPTGLYNVFGQCWQVVTYRPKSSRIFSLETDSDGLARAINATAAVVDSDSDSD